MMADTNNRKSPSVRGWLWHAVALGAICIVSSCDAPSSPAPKALTISRLKQVYYLMGVLESEKNTSIDQIIREVDGSASAQLNFAKVVVKHHLRQGDSEEDAREQLCQDGYGNTFNVEFKTNLVGRNASTPLLNTSFDVVVWSSGKNAINEFGNGDDVVLAMPAVTK